MPYLTLGMTQTSEYRHCYRYIRLPIWQGCSSLTQKTIWVDVQLTKHTHDPLLYYSSGGVNANTLQSPCGCVCVNRNSASQLNRPLVQGITTSLTGVISCTLGALLGFPISILTGPQMPPLLFLNQKLMNNYVLVWGRVCFCGFRLFLKVLERKFLPCHETGLSSLWHYDFQTPVICGRQNYVPISESFIIIIWKMRTKFFLIFFFKLCLCSLISVGYVPVIARVREGQRYQRWVTDGCELPDWGGQELNSGSL